MKIEEIEFYGHSNVTGTHKSTLEITTEKHLTDKGDCIIGVNAKTACNTLNSKIKEEIQKDNNQITIELIVEDMKFKTKAMGSSKLSLKHKKDIVLRKSKFTCTRTVGINAENAAIDIPREMISKLRNPNVKGLFRIIIGETE
jgi:hypothetical protein|tara:strand:- start:433 stop:861 length:429 start_codon:yes stop_codon:yes gene_type:complete